MLRYVLAVAAVPVGLLALTFGSYLLPPLAVGLWAKSWDPSSLTADQQIFNANDGLPKLWESRPALVRGRYALALSRFRSAADCLVNGDAVVGRIDLKKIRHEIDFEVCSTLVLSDARFSYQGDKCKSEIAGIFVMAEFDCAYDERVSGDNIYRSLFFRRNFKSLGSLVNALPVVSDWTGFYILGTTVFRWLSFGGGFDLKVGLRYIGDGVDLAQRVEVDFRNFSK